MSTESHVVVWTFALLATIIATTPPLPQWPTNYKACISMKSGREYIPVGWYVDSGGRRMRLDSYGIPSEDESMFSNESEDDFEYACSSLGRPLYVFLYHYMEGKEYDIFPSPDPPYTQCTILNISNPFPPSPLLPGLTFVERETDNITTFDHWRAEYFLFTMDYMFHAINGLPYKLFVNSEEQVFSSIEVTELEDNVFLPPENVVCKWG